jgi:hypothetical protein
MKKKILVAIALIVAVFWGIVSGYSRYENKYGERYRTDISPSLIRITYKNYEVAIADSAGKVIGDRFDGVDGYYNCSLLVVHKDGKYGYISSKSGKIVFEPKFQHAWVENPKFGIAAFVKDNKLGFINAKTGKYLIEPQFDFESDHHGGFIFNDNGYCIIPGVDAKFGVIDTTGSIILPAVYDNITINDMGIAVRKGYDQKLLAFNGKDVLNTLWLNLIQDDEGTYDDLDSELVTPFYEPAPIENESGVKSPYIKFRIANHYGVFDEKYNIIIPPLYDEIQYNGNGFFGCYLNGDGGAIINAQGKFVHEK